MNNHFFCDQCGANLQSGQSSCPQCNTKIDAESTPSTAPLNSKKSGKIAFVLCLFFGMMGIHRFYVGKIGTGLLNLVTAGCLGIWTLIDLILITQNKFYDKQGLPLKLTNNLSTLSKILILLASICSWILGFIVLMLALVGYTTYGLIIVVQEQLNALHQGNIKQAYAYTAKEFQHAIPLNNFKLFVEQFPALTDNKSIHFAQRGIENSSAYLQGIATAKNGTQTKIRYQFIKEDGAWKILAIKIVANTLPTQEKP